MKKLKLIIFSLLILSLGCGIKFQSPIVFKRAPQEEEETPPPRRVIIPPPPTPKKEEKPKKTVLKKATIPEGKVIEEEIFEEEIIVEEDEPEKEPQEKTAADPAKAIVILSPEYLAGTDYKILERITVKEVSQKGFPKKEAREALQFEAFRRFGSQAKALINIEYQEKSDFIPGTERFLEVSGDVITWEGTALPEKTEIETEAKPEQPLSSEVEEK